MNVALCDDDKLFLQELKKKLVHYNCSIYTYNTVEELINSNIAFDIAFLDIEFEKSSTGFQAARFLHSRNKKCIISFLTNYNQYAIKGYEYQPFRYILKTEPEKLINRYINAVFIEYRKRLKIISGTYNGYTFSVPIDEIYYISISNHVITLHSTKGDFELYKQMKELNDDLSELGFLRCHRGFMVNTQHIFIMRSDYFFILDDPQKTAIPIGIRYRESAKTSYLNVVSVGGKEYE